MYAHSRVLLYFAIFFLIGTTMAALADLQNVLTEFYAQASSPERLAQLQQSLIQFEQEPSSWTSALNFLSSSTDQYVCMFSLGVIETTVRRRWALLSEQDKQTISVFLERFAFATESPQTVPFASVLKCKSVKIWTTICKQNFNQLHLPFLEKLVGLLRIPQSIASETELQRMSVSLTIFKAAFEEFMRPDTDLGNAKVKENVALIGRFAPQIFSALTDIGEKLLGFDCVNAVSGMFSQTAGHVSESLFYTSLRHILCLNSNILFAADPEKKRLSSALLKVLCNLLGCLTTFLAAAPITTFDHCRLYSFLYIFTVMGSPKTITSLVDASRPRNLNPTNTVVGLSEIGIQSLSCLAEVVERKDVSREAIMQHLSHIYRAIYWDMLMEHNQFPLPALATDVINTLANSGASLSTVASTNNLSGLANLSQSVESTSEEFYQKLADILRLMVTNFLFFFKNLDTDPAAGQSPFTFTPTNFLHRVHFFTFTTCRAMLPVYLSCMELWTSYLDFTKAIFYGDSFQSVDKKVELPQQTQVVISNLCTSILSTIYFSESATYLDALDNEDPSGGYKNGKHGLNDYIAFFDDSLQRADSNDLMEDQSEYGQFMQASLTLLSSIAFFNPKEVLHNVAAKFQEGMNVFSQLSSSGDKVNLEEHTTRKLHSVLQDLATCLNCLTYLSEHFGSLQDASMLQWLLQALVFNLGSGVSLCDRLTGFREDTIRQDVVQVVIENINLLRCLLASGFIVVLEDPSQNPNLVPGGVALGIADKEAMTSTLVQFIHHLLLKSPITTLKLSAAQLLQAIVVSAAPPGFLPPANLLANGGCLLELVNCCCDMAKLKSFSIPVQRLLIRTVTAYLLTDEAPTASQLKTSNPDRLKQLQALTIEKKTILSTRLIPVFAQTLQRVMLTANRDAYFAGLCWLNEALAALTPMGSKSRRVLYDALVSTGLLDRIWQCLETSNPSPQEAHLFVAHLSFFVQFTDIYGSQKATVTLIPGFVATVMRLLQQLERNTASARLVSPIMSHLVHLINVLVQNRTVFPPMASEVLRFVSNCLVVNLAGGNMTTDLPSIVAASSRNDPDLCLRVFNALFQTMSFGYTKLSQDEDLGTFLRTVLAVFSPGVPDSRLITACMEALCELNHRHRLFSLPAFLSDWRGQFSRNFFTLLTSSGSAVQQGSDAEAALIKGLHGLYSNHECFATQDFWLLGLQPFLSETVCLPADRMEYFSQLALTFSQNGGVAKNLRKLDEFSATLIAFLVELRLWIRTNASAGANTPSLGSLAGKLVW